MNKLTINYPKRDGIKEYAHNKRIHQKKPIQKIVNSIENFKFNNPILIDENNKVIAGHGRLIETKTMKMKKLQTIRLSHLNEAQKCTYCTADNS